MLVSSPPGVGRSSVLRSLARDFNDVAHTRVLLTHGDVIASKDQLFGSLSDQLDFGAVAFRHWLDAAEAVFHEIRAQKTIRFLLLIDDFDQLAYKREPLLEALGGQLATATNCLLVATCRNATVTRLTKTDTALSNLLRVVALTPMNDAEALELVEKRAPELAGPTLRFVVSQAGGHPAAIVFLCRVFQLRGVRTTRHTTEILRVAAELAGAVYAEHWAELGPQQRAILWHISQSPDATSSTAKLAAALILHPSHVSAQLTRLVDEGLVARAGSRGKYRVAPLLALWITERAVRALPLEPRSGPLALSTSNG